MRFSMRQYASISILFYCFPVVLYGEGIPLRIPLQSSTWILCYSQEIWEVSLGFRFFVSFANELLCFNSHGYNSPFSPLGIVLNH